MKFTQPVSMVITLDQLPDFQEKLRKLGYTPNDALMFGEKLLIYTNAAGGNNEYSTIDIPCESFETEYRRHFIDHYNPELFMALAAMTDKTYGIAGEWWVHGNSSSDDSFTVGKLYKALRPLDEITAFMDDEGELNGHMGYNLKYFTKATKEQLISHFSKQPVMEQKLIQLSRQGLREIYPVICGAWQAKLMDLANKSNQFEDYIDIPEEDVIFGFYEANTAQIKIIEKWIKRPEKVFDSSMLQVGEMMIHKSQVLLKSYDSIVSLTDPYNTWNHTAKLKGEKLEKGKSFGVSNGNYTLTLRIEK